MTLWKKGLTKYVSKINCNNFRIQATKFAFPGNMILGVNSYFPCDLQADNFDEAELLKLLSDISNVIEASNCQKVVLLGDFNADFNRCTRFTVLVYDYLTELSLKIIWYNSDTSSNNNISTVDHTYGKLANDVMSFSTIDPLQLLIHYMKL